MAARIISVEMVSTYRGDLERQLKRDRVRIKWEQRRMRRNPLLIPVKLDLSGIKGQAQAISKMVLGEVSQSAAGILGADGRPATSSAKTTPRFNNEAGVISTTTRKTFDRDENLVSTVRGVNEQLGRGITMMSNYKGASQTAFETVYKDLSGVADLQERVNTATRKNGVELANARGRGDRQAQLSYLRQQKFELDKDLADAGSKSYTGSSAYTRGENKAHALANKIAALEGRENSAAEKAAARRLYRQTGNAITQQQRRTQEQLKGNKLAMEHARQIQNTATKEAEINRLYTERTKLFETGKTKFQQMGAALIKKDKPELADRMMRRSLDMQNQINQSVLDGERFKTAAMERQNNQSERARKLADTARAKSGTLNTSRAIRLEEHATKLAADRNKADMVRARNLPTQIAADREINRLATERQGIYARSASNLEAIRKTQASAGNVDNAAKAETASLRAKQAASRSAVQAATYESAAVARQTNDIERSRKLADTARKRSGTANNARSIRLEEHATKLAVDRNALEMARAQRLPNQAAKEAEINRLFAERQRIQQQSAANLENIRRTQASAGNLDNAAKAEVASLRAKQAASATSVRDANQQAAAVNRQTDAVERARKVADKARTASGARNNTRDIRLEEHATRLAATRNKEDMARAQTLPTQVAREAELNRLAADRSRIFKQSAANLDDIRLKQALAGNAGNAGKAEIAMNRANQSSAQASVDAVKKESAAIVAARTKAEAAATAARRTGYAREMQDIKTASEKRMSAIQRQEQTEKRAATDAAGKSAAAMRGHRARQAELQSRAGLYGGVQQRADKSGDQAVGTRARGLAGTAASAASKDMQKFTAATAASGHALNFHSSSLLRNAMTYARWMIPVQAIMSTVRTISAGIGGAVRIDRQFATLRAVFRGTDQEAQKLKISTIELAVVQGRSADEAMDSAIRWSRLGLSRVQVLQATKVSLMASNVAEVSAAEAAEKLSAIYASYRQNVGDLEVVLGRLNAISNKYNVTNKDLLEGIVRVAGVARQAGLDLRDVEGMIAAVTGATGRPGQEAGNALRFVVTRLSTPEIGAKLKENFDIDLTDANGDLKKMSDIFKQLAEVFPTLNNYQRQHFLKLTAGSRQTARMALIMDQYRQSQILAAEASLDVSSAYEENEKILSSLQSRVDSLKSSWTQLFTTMGDAGALERIGATFKYIEGTIIEMNNSIDNAGFKSMKFNIPDPISAKAVQKMGGGENPWLATRDNFTQDELDKTIAALEKGVKQWNAAKAKGRSNLSNTNIQADGAYGKVRAQAKPFDVMRFRSIQFKSFEDAEKTLEKLKEIRDIGKTAEPGRMQSISLMTKDVDRLRERLSALQRMTTVFDTLGAAIQSGSVSRESMIRDFENAAHVFIGLDGDATRYMETMKKFRALLDAGDMKGIAELSAKLAESTKGAIEPGRRELKDAQVPVMAELEKKLADVKAQKDALNSAATPTTENDIKSRIDQAEELEAQLKTIQDKIRQISQDPENFKNFGFNAGQTTAISKFFSDLIEQAEAFQQIMSDLAPDSANDPVARIYNEKRSLARVKLNALKQSQAVTNDDSYVSEKSGNAAIDVISKARVEGRINDETAAKLKKQYEDQVLKAQEAVSLAKGQVDEEQKQLEIALRKLEIEENIMNVKRAQTDAGKRAEMSSAAFRYGDTESGKDANVARATIERARQRLSMLQDNFIFDGPAKGADVASAKGQILQDEATARAALESIERRQYELDAARKQVAFDTVRAMREQNEEAAKRFAMASREDQLRAAALKRPLRDTGPVSGNEFFMLSQPSRQVFRDMLPGDAPDFLNEAKEGGRRALMEINRESLEIASSIGGLSKTLKAVADRIDKETRKGGLLEVNPDEVNKGAAAAAAAAEKDARDKNPTINLSFGNISVAVNLAKQVDALLTSYVDKELAAGLAALEARLRGGRKPAGVPSAVE